MERLVGHSKSHDVSEHRDARPDHDRHPRTPESPQHDDNVLLFCMCPCVPCHGSPKRCPRCSSPGRGETLLRWVRLYASAIDTHSLVQDAANLVSHDAEEDVARRALKTRHLIRGMQDAISAVEQCPLPVIALVHGACIGGAIDLISAACIRWCSEDAFFAIKEIDIGIAADLGTLQRLPKIVGNDSLVRELVYTGRRLGARDAYTLGLVSRVCATQNELYAEALQLSDIIASKSPIALIGSKHNLVYARDHGVQVRASEPILISVGRVRLHASMEHEHAAYQRYHNSSCSHATEAKASIQ